VFSEKNSSLSNRELNGGLSRCVQQISINRYGMQSAGQRRQSLRGSDYAEELVPFVSLFDYRSESDFFLPVDAVSHE
jgi:hypothetical protein